jgi:hypothetical protein
MGLGYAHKFLAKVMDRRPLLQVLWQGLAAAFCASAGGFAAQSEAGIETPSRTVFFEAALPILSRCTAVLAFKFQKPIYAEGPDLTLKNLKEIPKPRELDEHEKSFLVCRMSDPSSYIFGLQKPMQFYADYGLIFKGSDIPNMLLISTSSKSARLVLESRFSPAYSIVNIDPVFPELIEQLKKALQ